MIIKVWNGTSFETKYPNVAIGSIVASGTPSSTTALFGDGSWKTTNTGTVTSVGVSVPTGLSVSSSPVTSSGTIAIAYATGYAIPTTAKQTNWDAAYGWGNHASAGYATSSGVTSVSLASGTNNGTLKITVNGSATDNIAVKGLGSAAYTASTAYAEATHGHGNLKSGGTIVAPVTATTPTHVPIFTSDPNSTARTMNTMTLANFKGLLFSVSGTTLTITL